MRFTRYPNGEPYQITPRKLAAARRAVQKDKDRYPLFPELVKHQTAEDRLTSIAVERETWWQEMRERQARLSKTWLWKSLRLSCADSGHDQIQWRSICTSKGRKVTRMTCSGPLPIEPSTSWTVTVPVFLTGLGAAGAFWLLYRTR